MNPVPNHKDHGTFTISIDLELGWGDKGKDRYLAMHRGERDAIQGFLFLCEKYSIVCTWATVGALFLKDPAEFQSRNLEIFGRGKILQDKIFDSAVIDEALWFGEDIIENILSCKIAQEIGCHTFFHTLTSEANEGEYERELQQCRALARDKYGLEMKSFVYPRNEGGYQDALVRAGLENVRGSDPARSVPAVPGMRQAWNFLSEYAGVAVQDVSVHAESNGLIILPGSYFFPTILRGGFRAPMSQRLRKCRSGIEHAIKNGTNVHLWFHPHNISVDLKYWLSGFEGLFQYVAKEREAGRLKNETMGNLSDNYRIHEGRTL